VPFVSTEIRQTLNLATSCPSQEDVIRAAQQRGWHWNPDTSTLTPAAPPVAPVKKAPKAKTKAEDQVLVDNAADAIPADS
jgi:hypothetical protein